MRRGEGDKSSSQFADAHRASPSGRSGAYVGFGYENCPDRRFKIVRIFRFNLGSPCHHSHQIYCFALQFEFKSLALVSQFGWCTWALRSACFATFPLPLLISAARRFLSTYFLKFVVALCFEGWLVQAQFCMVCILSSTLVASCFRLERSSKQQNNGTPNRDVLM